MSSRVLTSRSTSKKPPVVIDLGSAFIRCGFAGDARPIDVIPSVVGDAFAADESSVRPRTREEWEMALTPVFARLYTDSLQCRPRERGVVVCESMVSPRPLREAVARVLFRFLQVPSLHLCAGPAPVLLCTGLDTGIAVDIGSDEAHAVAVYRGASLQSSYVGVPLGCRAVHERVGELIAEAEKKESDPGRLTRRPLTAREMEEVAVRACLVPVRGIPKADQVSPMEFVFLGSRRVTVSGAVRTTAVQEALFEGDEEGRTLATLVLDCLKRCPRDCRRALVQNMVVAGGGGLVPGLCARLGEEVRVLAAGGYYEYAWARAAVFGEGSGEGSDAIENSAGDSDVERGGLCVVRVPVRRDHLLWTGASLMSSCLGGDVLGKRSLNGEQYERGGGRLPDWMSVSSSDWVFQTGEALPAA